MFQKFLIRGVLFAVPIWLTAVALGFLNGIASQWFGPLCDQAGHMLLPDTWQVGWFAGGHIPGFSFVAMLAVLTSIGFVASCPVGRQGLRLVDCAFLAIPGVRSIYSSVRKIIDIVGDPNQSKFKKVVMVPSGKGYVMGFVTGATISPTGEKCTVVFAPLWPNLTSGDLMKIPDHLVQDTTLSLDEAIKIGVSLGVLMPPKLS